MSFLIAESLLVIHELCRICQVADDLLVAFRHGVAVRLGFLVKHLGDYWYAQGGAVVFLVRIAVEACEVEEEHPAQGKSLALVCVAQVGRSGIDIVNLVKREVTGGNQTIGIRPEGGRRVVFREIEKIIVAGTLRDADSLHVVSGSVSVVDETS